MKCDICGTTEPQYNWITLQYSDSAEDEAQTIAVLCTQCYEKEAINGI